MLKVMFVSCITNSNFRDGQSFQLFIPTKKIYNSSIKVESKICFGVQL